MKSKNFGKKESFINKEPLNKAVEWNINRICNYNCSYCLTSSARRSRISSQGGQRQFIDVPDPCVFLDKFSKSLSGSWIFYLGGKGSLS